MKESIKLKSFVIDITSKCNCFCKHCYNESGENKCKDEIDNRTIIELVDDIIKLSPQSICLTGGEPLLRKELVFHLAERITYCSNIKLILVTNGILLDEKTIKTLKEKNIYLIQISLDSVKPEIHNWIRNRDDAFELANNAIKLVASHNILLDISAVPIKKNYMYFDNLIKYAYENKCRAFRTQPIMKLGRAENIENMYLNDVEYFYLKRIILKNKMIYRKKLLIEWGDPIRQFINIFYYPSNLEQLRINAQGDIMVSPYLPISVGNIKRYGILDYYKNGLEKIYYNKFIKKVASQITSNVKMNISKINNNFPENIFKENINMDLIDKNIEVETMKLLDKYFGEN